MSNPLALFPLAIAGARGRIGAVEPAGPTEYEVRQLVAAGLTLLQRSAPLVRALSGKRSAILLPMSARFLAAIAASDGRGAVLLEPTATPAEIALECADGRVGAIFTTLDFAASVPEHLTVVFLDDAPRSTRVVSEGRAQVVDLGSHHGLSLAGELGVEGREEEAIVIYSSGDTPMAFTHAALIANARSLVAGFALSASDHVLSAQPFSRRFALGAGLCAPLLAGARVTAIVARESGQSAGTLPPDMTLIVAGSAFFAEAMTRRAGAGTPFAAGKLRLCISDETLPSELARRWEDATGVRLLAGGAI